MRKLRVCIYGSTDLDSKEAKFTEQVTARILKWRPCKIVTGGVWWRDESKERAASRKDDTSANSHPSRGSDQIPMDFAQLDARCQADPEVRISTDVAALRACRSFADDAQVPLDECFQAWIPDDRYRPRPEIVRMNEVDGIPFRVMNERSALGRRLRMVRDVDLVVTVRGSKHTETVLEQAIEIERPVLPLPFFGGDSYDFWQECGTQIHRWFSGLSKDIITRFDHAASRSSDKSPLADRTLWPQILDDIIQVVDSARYGHCLVLLPFDEEHELRYRHVIEPAVTRHMDVVKLNDLPRSDNIRKNFETWMRDCHGVIADITTANITVMYEVGYAHALKISPLIISRRPLDSIRLPVYVKTENIKIVSGEDEYQREIEAYLRDRKHPSEKKQAE